jgi:16S rRNA (guanine1207-N2)-methyltransferase
MAKSAVKALLNPLVEGILPLPSDGMRVLYMNAQASLSLPELARHGAWDLLQDFKPWADRLANDGLTLHTEPLEKSDLYDMVLILAGRQFEEMRSLLGEAALHLKNGGWLVCAAENDAGGKRLPRLFETLGLEGDHASKHHARVVWGERKDGIFRADTAAAWQGNSSMRRHPDTGFISAPGLFSWDRIDPGSALLAQHMPRDIKGTGADFGCGYGYLAHSLLNQCPSIKRLSCFDADRRAVEAAQENLKDYAERVTFGWVDCAGAAPPVQGLDWVVMNPPFHEGKVTRSDIGAMFIANAAAALHRGGVLYMVANAHLPYEIALNERFGLVECLFEGQGYKIFRAVRKD